MTQKDIDKLRLIQVLHHGIPWETIKEYFCKNCSDDRCHPDCQKNNPTRERINFLVQFGNRRLLIGIGKCFKKSKSFAKDIG